MAKKNNNKVSKIKTNKINKEELINKKNISKNDKLETNKISNLDTVEEIVFSDDQLDENNDLLNEEIVIQEAPIPVDDFNEIEIEPKNEKVNNDYQLNEKSLVKKLNDENRQLLNQIENLKNENLKIKQLLESERQQLISKLEQKAAIANQQVEEKIQKLEESKKEEITQLKESVYIDVISNFLDPILLFESTVEQTSTENEAVYSYVQGYKMIISMFKDKLNNLGIEQIDVNVGDDFNESFMEAFDVEESSEFAPNKVIKIVNKGFAFKNKVIKFTTVIVSK